jgi:hypothetical protein
MAAGSGKSDRILPKFPNEASYPGVCCGGSGLTSMSQNYIFSAFCQLLYGTGVLVSDFQLSTQHFSLRTFIPLSPLELRRKYSRIRQKAIASTLAASLTEE